jgi:hypothetical protein
VAKVQAEWARDIPRLLIFDNCDDIADTSAEVLLALRNTLSLSGVLFPSPEALS